ncbi:MAG TPA: hypothetical protein PKX74_01005 [Leptospiraceae bacterium]|nr:hypothetical protein [Leptospirales bacterium]HMW60822.1 hypothetical protein [Leptospiraceae bacterium]HMY44017.1 hypothetical protein [Leptospiraceae bacterium]HNE22116.1 hypothetical protein [Leptospiraceae bacterium]HNJ03008.1 hypothetical protein [Leptospiraceae bacterium]
MKNQLSRTEGRGELFMHDVSGRYRFTHMTESGQTVTLMLLLTQVGTDIRGKLRSIFASAGDDQLYYTEEHDVRGNWNEGPIALLLPEGQITVESAPGGLNVTRDQTEFWKSI